VAQKIILAAFQMQPQREPKAIKITTSQNGVQPLVMYCLL